MAITKSESVTTSTLQIIKEWDDSMTDDQKRLLTRDIISKFPARAGKVRVFFDVEQRELVNEPNPGFTSGMGYLHIDGYKDNSVDLLDIYNNMLSELVMFIEVKTQGVIEGRDAAKNTYYKGFLRRDDMTTSPIETMIRPGRDSHPKDMNELLTSQTMGLDKSLEYLLNRYGLTSRPKDGLLDGYETLIRKLNCEMAAGELKAFEMFNGVTIDWAAFDTACVDRMPHSSVSFENVEMLCELAHHLGQLHNMKGALMKLANIQYRCAVLLPNLLVISGMLNSIGIEHYVTWNSDKRIKVAPSYVAPSYKPLQSSSNLSTLRVSEPFEQDMLKTATEFHMVYNKEPQNWQPYELAEWMTNLRESHGIKYTIGIDSRVLDDIRTLCSQKHNLKFIKPSLLLKMAQVWEVNRFAEVIQPPTEALTDKGGGIVFPRVNA